MSKPMSENTERLDAIQARVGAATRGPWEERCIDHGERPSVWKDEEYAFPIGMCVHENCQAEAVYEKGDAEFIAAAPSDVAFLLDLARKQQAAIDAVSKVARNLHDPRVIQHSFHIGSDPEREAYDARIAARIRAALEPKP